MADVKKRIEAFATRQRSRVYPCPRCGKARMAVDPAQNALSRRANVYVCDTCGMQEAMEDMTDSRTPLETWEISQHPERWATVTEDGEHISVPGHAGTWYAIDSGVFVLTPDTDDGRPLTIRKRLFLMEHEDYGDEAACVILDEDGALVMEDVWNGFDDLDEAGWVKEDEIL